MPRRNHVINGIINSIFAGFGIFILVTSFIRFKQESRNKLLAGLTDTAIAVIRVIAIGFLFFWAAGQYDLYKTEDGYSILTRFTGPYWFAYLLNPLYFGALPQILWVKRLNIKPVRVTIALLLLFAPYFERIVIIISSLHRDYVPASWTMLPGYSMLYDLLITLLIDLLTFIAILFTIHFVRSQLRRG
ncbi:MAG TPA: hypothetical protein VIM75_22065 [Ohtaekwangia sp.]|uniref:hypothetical protein n=1 Tax=Ohtaekwangia sp. TaxID=2066019 RepID=UPI002F927FC3